MRINLQIPMLRWLLFEELRILSKLDQEVCLLGPGLQVAREGHMSRPPSSCIPSSYDVGVVFFPSLSPRRADKMSDLTCCGGDHDGACDDVAFDGMIDWKAWKS